MFRPGGDAKSDQRGMEFTNASGEVIPACAIMRITGGSSGVYTVSKPNADAIDPALLIVNGELEVAIGKNGFGTQDGPMLCLYETGDGTPALGEYWGTEASSWKLQKNVHGFLIHFVTTTTGIVLATNRYRALIDVECVSGAIEGTTLNLPA